MYETIRRTVGGKVRIIKATLVNIIALVITLTAVMARVLILLPCLEGDSA